MNRLTRECIEANLNLSIDQLSTLCDFLSSKAYKLRIIIDAKKLDISSSNSLIISGFKYIIDFLLNKIGKNVNYDLLPVDQNSYRIIFLDKNIDNQVIFKYLKNNLDKININLINNVIL